MKPRAVSADKKAAPFVAAYPPRDRKLTNSVYTDSRLLPLDEAIIMLSGFEKPVTQIQTQKFVPARLVLSRGGKASNVLENSESGLNACSEHAETFLVTANQNGTNGARCRVRTCDFLRVKQALASRR